MRLHWRLDPEITFLNHGSFGACPQPVLEAQRALREQLETEPVRFYLRELEPMLDAAREEVARFVGARGDDLVFVPNATTGVSTVLRSLRFQSGDELLTTQHAYPACRNALALAAAEMGAKLVVAEVPFPCTAPDEVVSAVLSKVTPRTQLSLLDHVTSPTGMIFPLEQLVPALRARGVETLVDGAHAPGMVDLRVEALGAAYYTGNLHKWVCAPKGAAFLWVRRDLQGTVRPLTTSHGFASPRTDRSKFRLQFDVGPTVDPTPFLCAPVAIKFLEGLLSGGWEAVRSANHALACSARTLLAGVLKVPVPCPDEMLGSLAAISLPDAAPPDGARLHPLQDELFHQEKIEVPVTTWPRAPKRLIRISAQLYNQPEDYQRLAAALERRIR
jgi:isopenicillin-N epimerase